MTKPLYEALGALSAAEAERLVRALPDAVVLAAAHDFEGWAHEGQRPPPGDWRVWVMLAGRGFGKTRAGAEWVLARVRASKTGEVAALRHGLSTGSIPAQDDRACGPPLRIALVAATLDEARRIMVEGPSALLLAPQKAEPRVRLL